MVQRAALSAEVVGERSGRWQEVEPLTDGRPSPRVDALVRELRVVLEEIAGLRRSRRLPEILRSAGDAGALTDAVTAWSEVSDDHRLTVLEATEVGARVELVLAWAKDHLAELKVNEQIRSDVTEGVEKQQREYLLRQQLAAIRKELGEDDGDPSTDYRARLAELTLPAKVRETVEKEIDRLERTSNQSPEQGWIRTWLDRVLDLPWGRTTADNLDLVAAREVLDADHHGLDDVKDRIVEFLAVRKLRHERGLDDLPVIAEDGSADDIAEPGTEPAVGVATAARRGGGAIVTLVGPPGVGKTSLGESVARAMGRRFVRVALGGVRDEAEIRGHRRTYVGSQPGRIARAITEAGTMNPVVLLDEVDKLSAGGWSGDPTAALLEVLDPAQNHTFRDHYLEVDLDLSDVVFLATANMMETIPGSAARPDGAGPPRRLHRGREGLHRPQAPAPAPAGGGRAARGRGRPDRRRPAGGHRRLHPGGRGPQPRAGAGQAGPQGGDAGRHRTGAPARSPSSATTSSPTWAAPASTTRPPTGSRCPAWPRVWPSPASAAMSCSSRPRRRTANRR